MISCDHLVPVEGYLTSGTAEAYHIRLRELLGQPLHRGFWCHQLARVLVRPSFAPEYALSLEKKANAYFLVCTQSTRSIWQALQASQAADVTARVTSITVSAELAQALVSVWGEAVGQTRYPAKAGLILDGTYYQFVVNGRSGQTHSPDAGNMGRLVALTEALRAQAQREESTEAEAPLLRQAQQLLTALQPPAVMQLAEPEQPLQELMQISSTQQLLEKIRARPALYLGRKSVVSLWFFLQGWNTAHLIQAWETHAREHLWRDFQAWVEDHYRIQISVSWAHIIAFHEGGDGEWAFDTFFRLYDDFLSQRAADELPDEPRE